MGVILERKKRILLNEPHLVTTTPAGIANFSTDMIAPLKSCKVEFSPVQSGSGDPSPDNVRPISGWTGLSLLQRNKNILDPSIRNDWGPVQTFGGDPRGSINGDLILPAGTYTFSTNGPLTTTGVKKRLGYLSVADAPITFTLNETAEIEILYVASDASYNYQLEIGFTATSYEPYTGSTIPIDWTTEAGTVYGGYADLVSGELVSVMGVANLGALAWSKSGNVFSANLPDAKKATDTIGLRNAICEKYKLASTGYALYTGAEDKVFLINSNYLGSQGKVYIGDSSYQTAAELKTSLSDVKLAYELATPITYQLTPTQLKSLRGVNNIWSDANGDISVKYWTH